MGYRMRERGLKEPGSDRLHTGTLIASGWGEGGRLGIMQRTRRGGATMRDKGEIGQGSGL